MPGCEINFVPSPSGVYYIFRRRRPLPGVAYIRMPRTVLKTGTAAKFDRQRHAAGRAGVSRLARPRENFREVKKRYDRHARQRN
jgi:hypothetical protein